MSFKQTFKRPWLRLYFAVSRRWPRTSRRPPAPGEVRKILLLQFGGIGDSLRMIPLIRMLGERFPAAELATLTDQFHGLSDLMPEDFPSCRHLTFDFAHGFLAKLRCLRALRREHFDVIVVPIVGDGFVEVAILARLIGARNVAGFDLDGGGLLYTHSIAFQRDKPLLAQYGQLLHALGCTGSADNIPLRRSVQASAAVANRLQTAGIADSPFVVLHPWVGHHERFRAWPAALFRDLVARLTTELRVSVILVGSQSERTEAARIFGGAGIADLHDWTGMLSFVETIALVERSRCLVCNDSCLIMVADALGVPSVAIFGSTTPEQVLASSSICRAVVTDVQLACRPCYLHQSLFSYRCEHDFKCLESVPVERVLQSVCAAVAGVAA
jgi:heptosyltransferase-2